MSLAFDQLCREAESARPRLALVLGSGMTAITGQIRPRSQVSFADIPGMVAPTVAGHTGHLILGELAGKAVLMFTGRLHFYEGNPWQRVVRPMELARELGVDRVILTNASGGIAEPLGPGSLMALTDHLEWNQPYPRRSARSGDGPSPYAASERQRLKAAAHSSGIELHEGVYLAVTGPCYETPSEIRAMRECGADAVGMSTTREALRAAELGMNVAAISCIANRAAGLSGAPLSHREVLEVVSDASHRLAKLLLAYISAEV